MTNEPQRTSAGRLTKPFQGTCQSVINFLIITVAMESLQEFWLISFAVV